MATTLPELMDWLQTLDETTLLELLDISSEEIVQQFADRIEENYTRLLSEREQISGFQD